MPSLRREWREGGAPKSTYSPMVSSWQRPELPHDCRYLGYFVLGEKSAASAYPCVSLDLQERGSQQVHPFEA